MNEIGMSPDAIVRAIAFAIEQPSDVDAVNAEEIAKSVMFFHSMRLMPRVPNFPSVVVSPNLIVQWR